MGVCVNCKSELPANEIIYNVTDLDTEVMKLVEESIGREAKVHDSLCAYCFSIVVQPSQDEEDGSVKEAEIEDPLSEPQEIQLKSAQKVKTEQEYEDLDEASSSSEDDPGPVLKLHSKTCVVCSEEFDEEQLFSLPLGPERDAVENHIHPKKLSRHSVICKDCLQITNNIREEQPGGNDGIDLTKPIVDNDKQERETTEFIYVPNYYLISGTKKCFVKNCQNNENTRKVIPRYMRRILLENYNVFLSRTACSCAEHRKEYYRDWSHLRDKKLYQQKFNSQQIEEMLEILRSDP